MDAKLVTPKLNPNLIARSQFEGRNLRKQSSKEDYLYSSYTDIAEKLIY
jgi:hypothetical protein